MSVSQEVMLIAAEVNRQNGEHDTGEKVQTVTLRGQLAGKNVKQLEAKLRCCSACLRLERKAGHLT